MYNGIHRGVVETLLIHEGNKKTALKSDRMSEALFSSYRPRGLQYDCMTVTFPCFHTGGKLRAFHYFSTSTRLANIGSEK